MLTVEKLRETTNGDDPREQAPEFLWYQPSILQREFDPRAFLRMDQAKPRPWCCEVMRVQQSAARLGFTAINVRTRLGFAGVQFGKPT